MARGLTYVGVRKPVDMLSGVALFRSKSQVFGPSPRDRLVFELEKAKIRLPNAERNYDACRINLGKANACSKWQRQAQKSSAFRLINQSRKALRETIKGLAEAKAALEQFDQQALAA